MVGSHIRHHPTYSAEEMEREREGEEGTLENGTDTPSGNGFDAHLPGERADLEPIPQDLLQKYILYSKEKIPKLHNIDQEKMAKVYADIRTHSKVCQSTLYMQGWPRQHTVLHFSIC